MGAVGDRGDPPGSEVSLEISGDLWMVGDQHVADHTCDPLVGQQDPLLCQSPARPGPLHPVHVDHVGDPTQPWNDVEDAGVVTEGQPDLARAAMAHRVAYRLQIERRRAEPIVAWLRNADPLQALPFVNLDRACAGNLAVDDHPPTVIPQVSPYVLRRSLEAPVSRGHAVRPKDSHGWHLFSHRSQPPQLDGHRAWWKVQCNNEFRIEYGARATQRQGDALRNSASDSSGTMSCARRPVLVYQSPGGGDVGATGGTEHNRFEVR